MADSDKNILITPNRGSTTNDPKIEFTGGDNNTVTLTTLDDGTLSFSGSSGQLFSISDSLTGTIFSVNDVSGIPSIEVDDDGTVRLAEFGGNLLVGTDVDAGDHKVQIQSDIYNHPLYVESAFGNKIKLKNTDSSNNGNTIDFYASDDKMIGSLRTLWSSTSKYTELYQTFDTNANEVRRLRLKPGDHPKAVYGSTEYSIFSLGNLPTIANVSGLQTALNGKVDDSQVLTNVPSGAVFTDTNTWRPIHDTPVNGATTTSISSNWAFDNVKTAVPTGAVFTDTNTWRPIHDSPVNGATTTSISSNWAFDNVKTAVPTGAVFTDTVYAHPSSHPATMITTTDQFAYSNSSNVQDVLDDLDQAIANVNAKDPVLTLTGDVTGSATFTNLGNATLTATVANDSHTHDGRYYTESEADTRFVNVTGDTMTGGLTMSGGNPLILQDGNHYLKKISTGYSGVTIDGPQLQGHQGGELTTNYGGNSWAMRWNTSGDTVTRNIAYANTSARSPIFYDLDDSSYFLNPNGTSRIYTLQVDKGTTSSRDKIRLWNDSNYTIGMQSGVSYGPLNDWAMTFQFNHESDRGFWWGSSSHSTAQGAMALNTHGHLYVGSRVDAPIFYDSNNTAYYTDPASHSVFNTVQFNGQISNAIAHNYKTIRVYGDENTYYPVIIGGSGRYAYHSYSITRSYADAAPWDPIGTGNHKGGLTFTFLWSGDTSWGGNYKTIRVLDFNETYTTMVAGLQLPVTGGVCVWLRGGGTGGAHYAIFSPAGNNVGVTIYDGNGSVSGHSSSTTFTAGNGATYSARTDVSSVDYEIHNRKPISGSHEFRGSRYYDTDDTSYYMEPASISYLKDVRTNIIYDKENTAYYFGSSHGDFNMRNGTLGTTTISDRLTINKNRSFSGIEGTTNASGRAQVLLSSYYSDVIIASQQTNTNHGSTLSFTAVNPSNGNDYRKFVVNQGNWGGSHLLRFGWRDGVYANPHNYVEGAFGSSYDVLGLDGSSNIVYAFGQMRSPIYYDYNDTAWHVNPASTSRMRNIDVCSVTNTAYYYDAAIEVREYNMDGAQTDNWQTAPRVAFHWGGRVASSIALSSNGWINIMNNPGTGYESLRCSNFYATGNVTAYYSDERLKTKVGVIKNAVDKVLSIDTFKYVNNDIAKENGFTDEETQVGVSAQSVEKVLPEVVKHAPFDMLSVDGENTSKSGEWYKTVQYDRLVPLLIEAIKEQQAQIEELSSKLKSLEEIL